MEKAESPVCRILVTVVLVFSLYTLTTAWVKVNPVLSELMSLAESTNNVAADGISAVVGAVISLLNSEDAAEGNGAGGISEAGDSIIKALSDEKEVVGIISKGECTPYDCSKLFQIIGRYMDDETIQTIYMAADWLFYVVCALGVLAVILAISGKYMCAILYAGGVGLEIWMISSAVTGLNEALNISALTIMDSMKMAGAGAAAVGFFAFVGMISGGDEGEAKSDLLNASEQAADNSKRSRGHEEEDHYGYARANNDDSQKENEQDYETKPGAPQAAESRESAADTCLGEEDPHAGEMREKRKKVIWGILLSALLLLIVTGGVYTLVKNLSPVTIDLSRYTSLHIEGYDGYGRAFCDFAEDDFLQDLKRALLDKNRGGTRSAMSEEDAEEIARFVYESTLVKISEENSLSNGDEVALDVTVASEAVEVLGKNHLKASFVDVHIMEKVNGLPEVRDYDPFEDVSVTFQGAEPYGEAVVSYTGDYEDLFWIEAEPSEGLRNGDEVEITVFPEYDEETLIEEFGISLSRERKTVEVSGLLYYPERIEEINTEELSRISENAQRIARDHIEDEYESDEQLTGLSGCGQYFAAATAEGAQFHNQMYCLYEVHYANNSGGSKTYYYYIRLENIMVDPKTDDAVVDFDHISVPQKPDLSADTLNLSEFVVVRFLPPRILSGFMSEQSFCNNCILPLEDACIVSETFEFDLLED